MRRAMSRELLPKLLEHSARRSGQGVGRMLDAVCEKFGYSKHAIKLLRAKLPAGLGRPNPRLWREDGDEVQRWSRRWGWRATSFCGKRLV